MGPPFLANVGANSSFIIPIPRVYGAYIYIYIQHICVYIYNGVYEVTKTTQEHHLTEKQKNWLHPYPAAHLRRCTSSPNHSLRTWQPAPPASKRGSCENLPGFLDDKEAHDYFHLSSLLNYYYNITVA